jgi:hypothetical protein
MTVCDENPVAQLVFFLILHGSDQSKHVKIWLSLSHQHGTVPKPSTFMSIAFHVPCVGNVSTKEREMAVVANLRRSALEFNVMFQGKEFDNAPFLTPKRRHLWLQNH